MNENGCEKPLKPWNSSSVLTLSTGHLLTRDNHPLMSRLLSDEPQGESKSKSNRKAADAKTASLRAQLKQMLAQPLIARGISTRYVTSGSRPIVEDILAGTRKCLVFYT